MTEVQRQAKEEELCHYQIKYNKYMATLEALRNTIVEAVDSEYIEKLKHLVVDYDMCQPYEMLSHIKTHIPLTTRKEQS
jgi:hypothetical protein